MAEYRFRREYRTPYSEAYIITTPEDGRPLGRVDLHYTPSVVHAILCVGEQFTEAGIQELIDTIDEELVLSAEVPRDDFVVTVYQGREVGVYSDQAFGENGGEEEPTGKG